MPPQKPAAKTCTYGDARVRGPRVQALCIGVDNYHHLPKLSNAVRDAAAFAAKFQREQSICLLSCHALQAYEMSAAIDLRCVKWS